MGFLGETDLQSLGLGGCKDLGPMGLTRVRVKGSHRPRRLQLRPGRHTAPWRSLATSKPSMTHPRKRGDTLVLVSCTMSPFPSRRAKISRWVAVKNPWTLRGMASQQAPTPTQTPANCWANCLELETQLDQSSCGRWTCTRRSRTRVALARVEFTGAQ